MAESPPAEKRQKVSNVAPSAQIWTVTSHTEADTYKSRDQDSDSNVEGHFSCEEEARRAYTLLMIRDIEKQWDYDWNDFTDLPSSESLSKHRWAKHGVPSEPMLNALYAFYLNESHVKRQYPYHDTHHLITVNRANCWKDFHNPALSPDTWDFEMLFELLFRGEFVEQTRWYSITALPVVTDMAAWEAATEKRDFVNYHKEDSSGSSKEDSSEEEDEEEKSASEEAPSSDT